MITRKEYMSTPAEYAAHAHRSYYGQFVTPGVRSFVAQCIGTKNIKESTDPHFNDTPLRLWDDLHSSIGAMCGRAICAASTGGYSLSDTVCIAKEAARQIKEGA